MSSLEPSTNTLDPPDSRKDIKAVDRILAVRDDIVLERGQIGAPKPDRLQASVADIHGEEPQQVKSADQKEQVESSRDDVARVDQNSQSISVSSLTPLDVSYLGKKAALRKQDETGSHGLEDFEEEIYLDPTPKTPRQESSPSRRPSVEGEVKGEIQSIMDQFEESEYAMEDDEGEGSKIEIGGPRLEPPIRHPPRRSSLEPLRPDSPPLSTEFTDRGEVSTYPLQPAKPSHNSSTSDTAPELPLVQTSSLPHTARLQAGGSMTSATLKSSMSLPMLPPPDPDPEPDLPFDFHRFLEQLRHRTADPVAKFLRSFLTEFGKKQWMVHEQMKIINDFLTFITNKMAVCEVWRGVSDAEFDNAKEGMEKLVMNRLYSQTFSPAIPAPASIQGLKGKRKNTEKAIGPGRRGQHQEDIERDEILGQKVRIYGWIQEGHLDIPAVSDSGRRFLILAQQELLKIKTYRAPRDKMICVLNCCKVIFGLLRNSKELDTSADSFVPLLIYVVLHANPDHLVSNVQYILRFRNQDKLGGETGYYLSSLMGAIQFIENLDRTSLTISDEDFEQHVEAAVSIIAERHKEEPPSPALAPPPPPPPRNPLNPQLTEKSGLSQPEVTPRNSIEAECSTPRRFTSSRDTLGLSRGTDGSIDGTGVSGLLRTIQKPLSSIGRIFSEEQANAPPRSQIRPSISPDPPPRLSPAVFQPPQHNYEAGVSAEEIRPAGNPNQSQERKLSAEDAAARQASAEFAEAQRIQRAEHDMVVETLAGMFPDLDRDVIDDVVRQKQGRVGLAVDACLALNS